jgi:hypothetical protein
VSARVPFGPSLVPARENVCNVTSVCALHCMPWGEVVQTHVSLSSSVGCVPAGNMVADCEVITAGSPVDINSVTCVLSQGSAAATLNGWAPEGKFVCVWEAQNHCVTDSRSCRGNRVYPHVAFIGENTLHLSCFRGCFPSLSAHVWSGVVGVQLVVENVFNCCEQPNPRVPIYRASNGQREGPEEAVSIWFGVEVVPVGGAIITIEGSTVGTENSVLSEVDGVLRGKVYVWAT